MGIGEGGLGTKTIVGIVVGIIIVVGIGIYFTRGISQIITKDPSEIVLSLNDVPSGYTVASTSRVTGPQEAAEQLHPNDVSLFQEWGFEVRYGIMFESPDRTIMISSNATRYSNVDGAKAAFDYRRGVVSDQIVPIPETIADESFATYYYQRGYPGLTPDTKMYNVYFRKSNVVVFTSLIHFIIEQDNLDVYGLDNVVQWAKLSESRV